MWIARWSKSFFLVFVSVLFSSSSLLAQNLETESDPTPPISAQSEVGLEDEENEDESDWAVELSPQSFRNQSPTNWELPAMS